MMRIDMYPATVEDASTQLLRSPRAEPEKRTRDRGPKKAGKPEARDQAQRSAKYAGAKGGGAYAQPGASPRMNDSL